MNFGSHLDDIVAVCVALVNVGTPGQRQGRAYDVPPAPALRHAVDAALDTAGRGIAATPLDHLPDFVAVAEGARPVFEQVDRGDLEAAAHTVNALLARYRPTPFLDRHGDRPWHLHFHGPQTSDPSGWGGSTATGLATVLGSGYADRLGVCAAPACDRVFVDVSRNGNRRFCSAACQNRVKAAAHRARLRA